MGYRVVGDGREMEGGNINSNEDNKKSGAKPSL